MRGLVVDSANRPVRDVSVAARGRGTLSTDSLGRFRFQPPFRGPVVFDLRRLGFMPAQYSLGQGEDTSIVITMLPLAQSLAAVEVVDRGARSARLAGFQQRLSERRRATTGVEFITAADIDRRQPTLVTSMLSNIPGIRIARIGLSDFGIFGIKRGGSGGTLCPATIYVDGLLALDADIDKRVHPSDLAGIEVYANGNAVPPLYQNQSGGCALVLLWTKGAG